ncbi:MAG TPA: hypothetical protein VKB57_18395 [Acidimicrobiales bacterium]|nr:hypothetical protein [Acidimicrobiales bacterium]
MAGHLRPRAAGPTRAGIVLLAVVLAGVGAGAAAGASFSKPAPTPVERQIQDEIEGLIASGVPKDSPKVAMLREQLAQLRTGDTARPPREPGVDTGAVLAGKTDDAGHPTAAAGAGAQAKVQPQAGAAATAAPTTTTAPDWQSGAVECEVVPNLLSAAEIAGATCASVPQPDGTSRYVAIGPEGVVRSVLFGPNGNVRRLPDTRAPAPAPAGTKVAATPQGDLRVAPPGRAAAVVDLP